MDIETTDNVVSLSTRRPMSPGKLREVEAYWMALADGRLMPKRSEVDPRGMTGSLDRVFLLEKMSPAQARFRVAGQPPVAPVGDGPSRDAILVAFPPHGAS